jgi:rRNA maturation protein Nop10
MEEIIITKNDENCIDEIYCMFYKCPKCGSELVIRDFDYCPGCGNKLKFELQ